MRLVQETYRIVFPLVGVTLIVVLFLKLLNAIPGYLDRGAGPSVVSVANLNEAQRIAGWGILTPSYFPDYLAWPPIGIEVRLRPAVLVKLVITSRRDNKPVLSIYQGYPGAFEELPEFSAAQAAPGRMVALSKTRARLSSLVPNRRQRRYLTWQYLGRRFLVVTPLPEAELLRIAASLMH